MPTSTNEQETRVDCTQIAQGREIHVTVGTSWNAKYYTVHFSEAGDPVMVESSFYGYKGRTTYRPVKKGGAAWRAAVAACPSKKSLGDTPLQNGQTMAELEAMEREHFGDSDKRTGIYADSPWDQWARSQAIRHLESLSLDLRLGDRERRAAAALAGRIAASL